MLKMNYVLRDINGKRYVVDLTTNRYYELKNLSADIFWEKYQESNFDEHLAFVNIRKIFPSVKECVLKNDFKQFLSVFQDNNIDHNINIFRLENNEEIPERVYLELTEDCPFDCIHCFCPRDKSLPQLSTDKIKSILDELYKLGTIYITMTGGDPLARRDFSELYLYAKRKGFLIYLFTNLYLLNKQHVDLFLQYPPFLIDATLYGSCNEVYYNYTGIKNAFDKVMTNLKTLKNNNINFRLKTPLSVINYHDIDNIEAIADQLSKYFTISTYIFPKLNGKKQSKELKCSIDTVINFEKRNKNRLEKLKYKYLKGKELLKKHQGLRCEQGINAFAINAYGKMFICGLLRYKGFDINNNSVIDGWEYIRNLRTEIDSIIMDSECNKCQHKFICNWCPGHSLMENGTLDDKIDYFCELSKKRENEICKKIIQGIDESVVLQKYFD